MEQEPDAKARIEAEASAWVERLRNAEARTRRRFEQWVTADPRHLQAYLTARVIAHELRDLQAFRWRYLRRMMASRNSRILPLRPARHDPHIVKTWAGRIAGMAAALMVVTFASYFLWVDQARTYATDVGERRLIRLADGSTVHLNAESRIRVSYSGSERLIELAQGEALFDVQRDEQRPFRVVVKDVEFEALGTSFGVSRGAKVQRLYVLTGRVGIFTESPTSTKRQMRTTVGANEQVTISGANADTIARSSLTRAQRMQRLDWTTGDLILATDTVAEALEEFNRYQVKKFRLEDPELAQIRLGGHFRLSDVNAFLEALATASGVRLEIVEEEDWRVIRVIERMGPVGEASVGP
jgi:transmembrane sensor